MASNDPCRKFDCMRIVVTENGPYSVEGGIPLVSKIQVVSEHGEPLTWQTGAEFPVSEGWYCLCRCGQSRYFPFCDGTHGKVGFDGTETAEAGVSERRARQFPGGTHIVVKKDASLCTESGFCGLRHTGIGELITASKYTRVRSLVIAMVERCPSGALTYRLQADGPDIEPDLPRQVAVTIESTSDGPIAGPLWVTGGIPIERADGQPFETRNRVTLCNCGHSRNKPLCDGTHRSPEMHEERRKRAVRK